MVDHFQYSIVYDTKKSLENDIGARTFDNDESASHLTQTDTLPHY